MGHGIALTLARAGQYDPLREARATVAPRITESLRLLGEGEARIAAILKKIEIFDTIPGAVREAAPEKLALKQAIFAEVEAHALRAAILASNTSVMPITQIMAGLPKRAALLAPIGGTSPVSSRSSR